MQDLHATGCILSTRFSKNRKKSLWRAYSQIVAAKFVDAVMLSVRKMCQSVAMFKLFLRVRSFCESLGMQIQSLTFRQKSRERCAGIRIQFVAIEDTSATTTLTRSFKCD